MNRESGRERKRERERERERERDRQTDRGHLSERRERTNTVRMKSERKGGKVKPFI